MQPHYFLHDDNCQICFYFHHDIHCYNNYFDFVIHYHFTNDCIVQRHHLVSISPCILHRIIGRPSAPCTVIPLLNEIVLMHIHCITCNMVHCVMKLWSHQLCSLMVEFDGDHHGSYHVAVVFVPDSDYGNFSNYWPVVVHCCIFFKN